MSDKLPTNWATCQLNDIATITGGGTPKSSIEENFCEDEGTPWLTPADLSGYKQKFISRGARNLTSQGYSSCSAKIMPAGTVLFSSRAPIGYVAIATDEISTNQGFKSSIPATGIDSHFLYYQLKHLKSIAEERATGSTFKELSGKATAALPVRVCPTAEQELIAEKLDQLLAQVDSIQARLNNLPAILKRFRQSVLSAAVARHKAKARPLGELVKIDVGHAFKSKEFTTSGIPLLRGQNIEPGKLRWKETKYYPNDKAAEFSHLLIKEGDIILAMDRPIVSTGLKLAKAALDDLPCLLVQRVARFKDFQGLLPAYLYLLLSDVGFSNYIQPNQTGSDIPHISGKQILSYQISAPALSEQAEIVRRVEQYFALADNLENALKQARQRVDKLTQSILAKAFRGELVPQNPDDEPAEQLLARIAQARKDAEALEKAAKKAARSKKKA